MTATLHPGTELYQQACEHDRRGEEAEALPLYKQAIELGLCAQDDLEARLGLGSTLRCMGRAHASVEVLREACTRYPQSMELAAFKALSQCDANQSHHAVAELIQTMLTNNVISDYKSALHNYSKELVLSSNN